MEESRVVAASMVRQAKKSMDLAISLMGGYDEETAEKIMELENQVDRYEDMLGTYLVKLSSRDLSGKDSRMLSLLLHSIGDFERISDHAVNLVQAAREMREKKLAFSDDARKELGIFTDASGKLWNWLSARLKGRI